jgi:hypothetical protein
VKSTMRIESELALTTNDLNTFSRIGSQDDQGFSNRSKLVQKIPMKKDQWQDLAVESYLEFEYLSL